MRSSETIGGRIQGVVVHGAGRGRLLGIPTANIRMDASCSMPPSGVYAGWLLRGAGSVRYAATISVGTNPTFEDGDEVHIEVHAHDLNEQIYDERVEIRLVSFLRAVVRFPRAGDLVAAARADVARSAALLDAAGFARAIDR